MSNEKEAVLKKRQETIEKIRADYRTRYSDDYSDDCEKIPPRCKSCEWNLHGTCEADDSTISDEDNVCLYWAPSYDAFVKGIY